MCKLILFFLYCDKEDEDEEESYLRRLDGGLFILQLVDYVLLEACTGCPPAVKQRVTRILAQRRASLKTIRHIMRGKLRVVYKRKERYYRSKQILLPKNNFV